MWHVREINEIRIRTWCINVKEGDHLKDPRVDGRGTLKWILNK
jgi:hypothetical protein